MSKTEKETLLKFFIIYFLSSASFILLAGYLFYANEKQHLISKTKEDLLEHFKHLMSSNFEYKKRGFTYERVPFGEPFYDFVATKQQYDFFPPEEVLLKRPPKPLFILPNGPHKDFDKPSRGDVPNKPFTPSKHLKSADPMRYLEDKNYLYFSVPHPQFRDITVIRYEKSHVLKKERITIIMTTVLVSGVLFTFLLISFFLAKLSLRPMQNSLNLLDSFLKDLIHDINTPISSILLNANSLKSRENPKENKKIRRIKASAKNIVSLYENINILLKENSLATGPVNLADLIFERVEYFKDLYPHINFQTHLSHMSAITNKDALIRILDNLISNACKYNQNEMLVDITLDDGKIIIKDSGVGIKDAKQVFERYYKEDDSGFGIGMHIVHRLSKELDIKIEVSSELNKGTTIVINLRET